MKERASSGAPALPTDNGFYTTMSLERENELPKKLWQNRVYYWKRKINF